MDSNEGAMSQERTLECATMKPAEMTEETFLKELYAYMRNRDTAIERIPHLGFKQIDLFLMFKTVQSLGGYNQVTSHQLWKQVYNKLGGNPRSTSAATCTRRHYEKLILPYECYLKGEGKKDLTLPRQLKRSRPSYLHGEEEVLRVVKCSRAYGHEHTLHQNSHVLLEDSGRVIPMPVHLQHYFHSSSAALPPYFSASHNRSTPLPHPESRPFYTPPPLEVNERPKQHLVVLRTLANEYMSSSGWAEPLNLSCKEGSISKVSQQPSSFTPTGSNKTPKFLNKVVPLYQACTVAKEEGPEVLDLKATTAKSSPAGPRTCLFPAMRDVIDLTSSAVSHNSSAETDTTITTDAFSTSTLWNHGLATPDVQTTKIPETYLPSKQEGESPKSNQSPLNLSCSMMSPSSESSGRMEIQIPLALLQDWFKGAFMSGLHDRCSAVALESSESQIKGREGRPQMHENSEAALRREKPSDLSFHKQRRHKDSSIKGEDKHINGTITKQRLTTNEDHYASISQHHHPLSTGITTKEWEANTDCRRGFESYNPNMFLKRLTASNPLQSYLQSKYFVAQKTCSTGLMEAQDLVVGRNIRQVQSASMKSPLVTHEQEQGTTGNLSQTYRCATSPALLGPQEKAQSMSGLTNNYMVNSTSQQPLTQEEYLKLRRLISSSL